MVWVRVWVGLNWAGSITDNFIAPSHQPFSCFKTRLKHAQRYKMSDFKDFKVADFNLWEWGRKEIIIGKTL